MSILPSLVELDPAQRQFLEFKPEASVVVNGIPNSGKTTLAFYAIKRLKIEGYSCIYLAPSSLFLKYAARLGAELGIEDFHCDTLFHYLNKGSQQYDYVVLDDSHIYSLSHLILLRQKGRFFYLFGNYSHPLLDTYYLGDDRLSDQELPPLEGVKSVFNARLFQLWQSFPKSFSVLLPWYERWSVAKDLNRVGLGLNALKNDSLREQCLHIKKYVDVTQSSSVCVAAYTRQLVQEASAIFREIGLSVSAYLPGKDGLDTVQVDSGNPLLTTIKSTIGLHFDDVFVLSFDKFVVKIHNNEAFEMVVTRAIHSITFFYTKEMAEPLASLPNELFFKPLSHGDDEFFF